MASSQATVLLSAPAPQPCGSLARVLARVYRESKPEVLDLGPLCGERAVYLAARGARLHVEEPVIPEPLPPRRPGETPPPVPPFRLDQPDARFHLVLAWEVLDFVPPDRLAEIGSEIKRVMRDGAWLFLFAHQKPPSDSEPVPRYKLLSDDLIVREPGAGPSRPRWAHPNRELERALGGLTVQGIQLQRSQLREIVVLKPGVG